MSTSSSTANSPSPPLSDSSIRANAITELTQLNDKHIVEHSLYNEQPELTPPIQKRDELVRVEPLYQLLERVVGNPLIKPMIINCQSPVMFCQSEAKSGTCTAVHTWCATNHPRVNVLVYKMVDHSECNHTFFLDVMRLASQLFPCILVMHRITQRAPEPLTKEIFSAAWKAFIRYKERKIIGVPAFWLLFVDRVHPMQVLEQWDCIDQRVSLPSFSEPTAFLQSMIQQRLRNLLKEENQVQEFSNFFKPIVVDLARTHGKNFECAGDAMTFVTHLFDQPISRIDSNRLREIGEMASVSDVLPCPDDFGVAINLLVRTKEDAQQAQESRAQEATAQRKAAHDNRIAHYLSSGRRT